MALTACGIKIAINGSETDVDVENDSASWTTKVGNVKVTTGGGSFYRDSKPGVANLDVTVPLHLAALIRTVTIAVTIIPNPGVSLPTPTVGSGAGAYRIIFHGDVQSVKGTPGNAGFDIVQVDAVSEMSGLLNRKARTAAAANTGPRTLLSDIETAHSISLGGNTYFPADADYPTLDRPAQKANTNGAWIRTALAGSGINMTEDWETSLTSPALMWRPDFQDNSYYPITDTNIWYVPLGHPWAYDYSDVGLQYSDFVARVNIEGENAAGTQHYGWARLYSAADRASVGNRDISFTTWIDTAAGCQGHARRLMGYQAEPTYMKLNQVTYNSEAMFRDLTTDEGNGKACDADYYTYMATACQVGDLVSVRGSTFGDGSFTYRDWPTHAPDGGDLYDTLETLWKPTFVYNATTAAGLSATIRAVTRTFTPTGGWDVTLGVDLVSGIRGTDVSEYSSGTY